MLKSEANASEMIGDLGQIGQVEELFFDLYDKMMRPSFLSLVLRHVTALHDKVPKCMVFLVLKLWEDQKKKKKLDSCSPKV